MSYASYDLNDAVEAAIDVYNDNAGNYVCSFGDGSASVFSNGVVIHYWINCPDGSPSELVEMAWGAPFE